VQPSPETNADSFTFHRKSFSLLLEVSRFGLEYSGVHHNLLIAQDATVEATRRLLQLIGTCCALAPLLDELFTVRLLTVPNEPSSTDVYSYHDPGHKTTSTPHPNFLQQQLAASFILTELIRGAGRPAAEVNIVPCSNQHSSEHSSGKLEPFAEYIIHSTLTTPAWELQSRNMAEDGTSNHGEQSQPATSLIAMRCRALTVSLLLEVVST
jgi:hypothetical protein